VLAATILGSSTAFIDSTVVNVALPALQSNLHATVVDVQWVIESYGLFLSALILVGGALGDSLGRRKMFLLGVLGFAVASAGCGFSSSIKGLLVWRSVQGIAAAFLVPGSLAIISSSFDEGSRGKAIGTWAGFTTITMAFGPVLGGWLIEHASWHWIFFLKYSKLARWQEWRKPTIKIRGKYTLMRSLRTTFPMSIWTRTSLDRHNCLCAL
jgi:MFS family permease